MPLRTELRRNDWGDPNVIFKPLRDRHRCHFHMIEILKADGEPTRDILEFSVHVHTLSKGSLTDYVTQARRYKAGELNFLMFTTPEGEFHFFDSNGKLVGFRAGGIEANERMINCSLDEFIKLGEEVGGKLSDYWYILAPDAVQKPADSAR